jgi:neurotransmitter:Na+ symporter, NSS family
VLPRAFAEMPGGRVVGTLFFVLLVLAALMPSIALLEPAVAWFQQRKKLSRAGAVWLIGTISWALGVGSALSFNLASGWHPLGLLAHFASMTFFDVLDYVTSNIMLPAGALLTSILMGWHLRGVLAEELAETTSLARIACLGLLRYLCPLAIVAIFIATAI